MSSSTENLLQAAAGAGLLAEDARRAILRDARRSRRDALDLATTRLRLPREIFYRALAERRDLPYLEANQLEPDPALLAKVPVRLLERKGVLPLRWEDDAVVVATADPDDASALAALRRLLDAPLRLVVADLDALRAVVSQRVQTGAAWDAVAALDALMREAWLRRASDIHLDPQRSGLGIRLRVDGRLRRYGPALAHGQGAQLLSRIKVLAGLDIAERRLPQDGGFTFDLEDDERVSVRLATIPARHGERATLRLMGLESQGLAIGELGLEPDTRARLEQVLGAPHGMVLLTGPTGSGKSTTLYAALRLLRSPERNLMSVEDPVELVLDGITQTQVSGKVSFASALRSLLRHDPDVLMVGEIRDRETADVAVKAAMTGHLLLSSLHTHRAVDAVARLEDLGCERYLVASTLRAVLAQRLVRRLCQRCRQPGEDSWVARGCPACLGTGYRGRVALAEGLWVDDDVARAIAAGAADLQHLLGDRTLAEDAARKVAAGLTSLSEVGSV